MAQRISELAVNIRVDGLPQVEAAAKKVDGLFSGLGDSLKSYLGPAALAGAVVAFVRMADATNQINQRLASSAQSAGELAQAQSDVARIAQNSAMSLRDTAELYTRIKRSSEELGVTQADVAKVTQSIADAFRIGGSSAQEQASAALQLSQSLRSGVLAGEEFRAVNEASGELTAAIARELGVSVGQLKELSKEGKLTADVVFRALANNGAEFRRQVERLPDTLATAWQRAENAAVRAVARTDQEIGASSFLVRLLNFAAEGLDQQGAGSAGLPFGIPRLRSIAEFQAQAARERESALTARVQSSLSAMELFGSGRERSVLFGGDAPFIVGTPGGEAGRQAYLDSLPKRKNPGPSWWDRNSQLWDFADKFSMSALGARRPETGSRVGAATTVSAGGFDVAGAIRGNVQASLDAAAAEIRNSFAQSIGAAIEDGLVAGIAQGVRSGSISEGFRALTGTLLQGLGNAMIQFGTASLKIGTLMQKLFTSLAGFLPGGAIGASVAMIAAGAALVGLGQRAAGAAFGGRGGGTAGAATGGNVIIERGTLGIGGVSAPGLVGGGATAISGTSVRVQDRPAVNLTVIGPNDPTAQRGIAEIIRKVQARVA